MTLTRYIAWNRRRIELERVAFRSQRPLTPAEREELRQLSLWTLCWLYAHHPEEIQ